jgi:acyl carrier protein
MTISSRTPEGFPARCPLCGTETQLEVSQPEDDATCPACGILLAKSAQLLAKLQKFIAEQLGVAPEKISPQTKLKAVGMDSLDAVELVMELEEELGIHIPDNVAMQLETIEDLIRYLCQPELPD